jgi:hypothetical protein
MGWSKGYTAQGFAPSYPYVSGVWLMKVSLKIGRK